MIRGAVSRKGKKRNAPISDDDDDEGREEVEHEVISNKKILPANATLYTVKGLETLPAAPLCPDTSYWDLERNMTRLFPPECQPLITAIICALVEKQEYIFITTDFLHSTHHRSASRATFKAPNACYLPLTYAGIITKTETSLPKANTIFHITPEDEIRRILSNHNALQVAKIARFKMDHLVAQRNYDKKK